MSPVQTNTQQGLIVRTPAADLSASEGCLAKISGSLEVNLAGVGDLALYVIAGATTGSQATNAYGNPRVDLIPLSGERNVRVISSGTIAAGVQVAPNASGQLRAAITSDQVIGITEEASVVGQYTLIRPCNLGVHA